MNTQNTRQIKFISTLVALMGLGLAGSAAHAADAPSSPFANKVVSYGDLNLASSEALDRLYHRIAAAALQVCGGHENLRAVADKVRAEVCTQQSIERAVAAINQPALTRLVDAKNGRTSPNVVLANRQ
jgi:UrcA family protein